MALGYFGIVGWAAALLVPAAGLARGAGSSGCSLALLVCGFGVAVGAVAVRRDLRRRSPACGYMFPLRFYSWVALAGSALAALELDRLREGLAARRRAWIARASWPRSLLAFAAGARAFCGSAAGTRRGAGALRVPEPAARGHPRRSWLPPRRSRSCSRRRPELFLAGITALCGAELLYQWRGLLSRSIPSADSLSRDSPDPLSARAAGAVPGRRRGRDALSEHQRLRGRRGHPDARPRRAPRLRRVSGRDLRLSRRSTTSRGSATRRAGARLPERALRPDGARRGRARRRAGGRSIPARTAASSRTRAFCRGPSSRRASVWWPRPPSPRANRGRDANAAFGHGVSRDRRQRRLAGRRPGSSRIATARRRAARPRSPTTASRPTARRSGRAPAPRARGSCSRSSRTAAGRRGTGPDGTCPSRRANGPVPRRPAAAGRARRSRCATLRRGSPWARRSRRRPPASWLSGVARPCSDGGDARPRRDAPGLALLGALARAAAPPQSHGDGQPRRSTGCRYVRALHLPAALGRTLVIGCGNGDLERALARKDGVGTILAVDADPTAVERARRQAERRRPRAPSPTPCSTRSGRRCPTAPGTRSSPPTSCTMSSPSRASSRASTPRLSPARTLRLHRVRRARTGFSTRRSASSSSQRYFRLLPDRLRREPADRAHAVAARARRPGAPRARASGRGGAERIDPARWRAASSCPRPSTPAAADCCTRSSRASSRISGGRDRGGAAPRGPVRRRGASRALRASLDDAFRIFVADGGG